MNHRGWQLLALLALLPSQAFPADPQPRRKEIALGGSQAYYDSSGRVAALGNRSRYENDDFMQAERSGIPWPRWKEFLRLGRWEYRYPNGKIKAHITYFVGWYDQCCSSGPCEWAYEFRDGEFEAFWPDGTPLAKGKFKLQWRAIDTSCEGGDRIHEAVIDPSSLFWDQAGKLTDCSILSVAEVDLENM